MAEQHSHGAHSHAHGAHSHSHDHLAANREHYDAAKAKEYRESKGTAYLGGLVVDALLRAHVFNPRSTICLDFACGPGLVAFRLAEHVKSIVGADTSPDMIEQFDSLAKEKGLDKADFHGIVVPDITASSAELKGATYDVVFCCQAFHHFSDVVKVAAALGALVKPGGHLLIVDLKKTEGMMKMVHNQKHHRHIVAHAGGFDADELKRLLESAGGFDDVTVSTAVSVPFADFKKIAGDEAWPPYTMEQAQEADARGDRFELLLASAKKA